MENYAAIIIAVVAILFTAVLGWILVYCCCCKKRNQQGYTQWQDTQLESGIQHYKSTQSLNDTLDLHQFTVKEAMQAFLKFLQQKEYEYNLSKTNNVVFVITGRGKHSPDGVPKIKPAVQDYLDKHSLCFTWVNPGMVKLDFSKKK